MQGRVRERGAGARNGEVVKGGKEDGREGERERASENYAKDRVWW